MPSYLRLAHVAVLIFGANAAPASTTCAPGGVLDLSKWSLQLSTGSSDTINTSALVGCQGYSGTDFYVGTDDSVVMKVPGSPSSSGCVTTQNSLHCRTELRETSPSSWEPTSPNNRLSATLAVITADDSAHGTVIGQIHIDDSVSSKPVCELYYSSKGVISMGVEQTLSGGNEKYTQIGMVPVGTKFSYEIAYQGGALSVSLNNGTPVALSQYELDNPKSYFKVGNYNQGDSKSEVHFYAIDIQH